MRITHKIRFWGMISISTISLAFICSGALGNPAGKATGGLLTFTVKTVTAGGNYAPKHVLAIWIEHDNDFVKSRKVMATVRKQYLYTWVAASNNNTVDAITGATLTSHQTHTINWNCKDLQGNVVPDGEYTICVEFTEKHAQGPYTTFTFTKGSGIVHLTPPDETYFKNIVIDFVPVTSDFTASPTTLCQNETVVFTDMSVNATSWSWNFGEGASPSTASTQGPHTITYTSPGSKNVSLTVSGDVTETKTGYITVKVSPVAAYTYVVNDATVSFTNTSINSTGWLWDFGDGQTSQEQNPVHTYLSNGTFDVSLTAYYLGCESSVTQQISITAIGIPEMENETGIAIYPNPGKGLFTLDFAGAAGQAGVDIFDLSGRKVISRSFNTHEKGFLDLREKGSGIYFCRIMTDGGTRVYKLVVN